MDHINYYQYQQILLKIIFLYLPRRHRQKTDDKPSGFGRSLLTPLFSASGCLAFPPRTVKGKDRVWLTNRFPAHARESHIFPYVRPWGQIKDSREPKIDILTKRHGLPWGDATKQTGCAFLTRHSPSR